MKRIAKFEKVSFSQFKNDVVDFNFSDEEIKTIYDNIEIPKRATYGSAGYDFFAPFSFKLEKNEIVKIPTGIRVRIDDGWFLSCYPRSGLGFKYSMHLANTVGIIDADYYNATNEGHIILKIVNSNIMDMEISKGKAFSQGIFMEFGITVDDDSNEVRTGGFGSSDK